MSAKLEKLWEKPDSEELFDEIDRVADKTGIPKSEVINLMLNGFSIKEKK